MTTEEAANHEQSMHDILREKILHVLSIYPKVSPSMLQVGIGTSISPAMWNPVLDQLVSTGVCLKTSVTANTPTNRQQSYTIISLAADEAEVLAIVEAEAQAAE